MDKSGISCEVRNSGLTTPFANDDEDAPTPRLVTPGEAAAVFEEEIIPPEAFGDASLMDDACQTPIKRSLALIAHTPGTQELAHVNGTKRVKEKAAQPIPSYTDQALDFSDEDIDGVPVVTNRASYVAVMPRSRPLVRRATDFPMPPPSPTHVISPRSARQILENVFEIPSDSNPVDVWRRLRDDHSCPICLKVLVRPVDICNCGHYVCRTHVIDIYQHGDSRKGIRCSVCRKEHEITDFNGIEIDQNVWSRILRAKFHPAKRRSVSPSRSLTPLRERFNKTFLRGEDF